MEEIAVLDGIPDYYSKRNVIDASAGANYSGGSSWPGDLPLTPSNAGLAEMVMGTNPADSVVKMSALEFQQLLQAAGANIRPDGAWGRASDAAVAALFPEISTKLQEFVRPYASNKQLLLGYKLVRAVINTITKRMGSGGAMSGLADVDRDLVNYYAKSNVIDASAGANYSGGSSWPGSLPLTPSNAGLADADLSRNYYARRNVIDASAGANYSGGSSWPGDLPLTPSNAGLAGTYEGRSLEAAFQGRYGSSMVAIPGYYNAGTQIDASAGANYSGGSSWPGDLPLTPSNAGLAGLDAVPDKVFLKKLPAGVRPAFKRQAGQQKLGELARLAMVARAHGRMDLVQQLKKSIMAIRQLRANVLGPSVVPAVAVARRRAMMAGRGITQAVGVRRA